MVAQMATAQLNPAGVGIHSVLIATDFSCCSTVALNLGLELAHDYQANAHVVFVLPSDDFLIAGPDAYVAAKDAARRDLLELKAELQRTHGYRGGEDYHLFLMEGDVAQSILDCARQKKVDMVVVGTHGRGGLGKMLMGSVAEHVFRQSPMPVMTVGPHSYGAAHGFAPRNILLASDFTPASERAAHYACALARQHNAKLTMLHVVDPAELRGIADRAEVMQGIKEKLTALLGKDVRGLQLCCRIEVGKLVPTILQTESEINADLLVMGVRPSSGLLDRLMWPHAYEIVREAACPVLTVRGQVLRH
jgi:nucleotide-binding universal stress UspA family protein